MSSIPLRDRIHPRQRPDDSDNNGWYRILPLPGPARRVDADAIFDWVVVGAGISGLACARELAAHLPDERVAIVEAQRVGYGPSGRNSGFVVTHHLHAPIKHPAVTAAKIRLATAGTEYLRRLVRDHQIQCNWNDWGRIYASTSDAGDLQLDGLRAAYARYGLVYHETDRDALHAITGSDLYRQGLHLTDSALVNPAALARGLAATLPANVTLYEESPVMEMRFGPPHRLGFADGTLACEGIVLCTNTFVGELGLGLPIVPVGIYASLTEPVVWPGPGPGERDSEFGIMEVLDSGATVRRTRDDRIFLRGRLYTYNRDRRPSPDALRQAEVLHRTEIGRRFPWLHDVPIADTWSGTIGFSRNEGQIFGELRPGVFANVPLDSSPVSRGSFAGKMLADAIVGKDSELLRTQFSLPQPAWLPPEPLLGWFVRRRLGPARSEAN